MRASGWKRLAGSRISRRLLVYVLIFSGSITLVLTAMQLYHDYRYDRSLIDTRLDQIRFSHLDSLANNLWTFNDDALRLQLEGLLRQPDLVYLEIREPDGSVRMSVGSLEGRSLLQRRYPLVYPYRGADRQLGELRVVASLDGVYQRLWNTFLVILGSQAVKTFLVSLFILFLFHKLVTRHLDALAVAVREEDPTGRPRPLVLDRPRHPGAGEDELDVLVTAFNDLRERMADAYAEVDYSRSVLEQAQRIGHLGSWEWDLQDGMVRWSAEARRILGWADASAASADLQPLIERVKGEQQHGFTEKVERLRESGEPLLEELSIGTPDGKLRRVEVRAFHHRDSRRGHPVIVGILHDVTEHCAQREALERMANYDALTGLPNRWRLHRTLDALTAPTNGNRQPFMLALLDLDGFKEINDALGHYAGDTLLRQLKPRLERLLAEGDMVARLGGDEFAFVIRSAAEREAAIQLVEAIRRLVSEPFDLEGMQVQVGASVGMVFYPEHAGDGESLLRLADVAMYQAKKGKRGHAVYEAANDPHTPRRLALISDVTRAIYENHFVLYYQPKIDLASGRVEAVEALLRWQHPTHGFIPPGEFIPLCEVSDLIRPLTEWVLERAILDCATWRAEGFGLAVAVNVSARNLIDHELPALVSRLLVENDLQAEALCLELTESALMDDPERSRSVLDSLRRMEVLLSIDDFGTGYSSLAYLKHLRVHELKIDRSFVKDVLEDENDAAIVRSTCELAHSLGMRVTAEGVETEAVLDWLSEQGCDMAQGFLVARPMPLPALRAWLEARQRGDGEGPVRAFDPA